MSVSKSRSMAGANARAVASVKQNIAKSAGASAEDDVDDDDDDDDGGSGGGEEVEISPGPEEPEELEVGGEPQLTPRQQKRLERRSLREENERLRTAHEEHARELAELRGRVAAMQQPAPQQPRSEEPDPLELGLRAARAELTKIASDWAGMTQQEQAAKHAELFKKQQDLRDEEAALVFRINQKKYGGGGGGISREDARAEAFNATLQQQYPDVAGNERAWRWACHLQNMEIEAAGGAGVVSEEQRLRITHTALQSARQRFRLQGAPAPTQQQRARYSGSGSGGGGTRAAVVNERSAPSFKFSKTSSEGKMMVRMATQAFPHIARTKGTDAAVAHWQKTAGKGVAKELSRKRS